MKVRQEGALAAVATALAAAVAGRGGQLLIEGAAGVGKTTVLRTAADRAVGIRVLQVAGVEGESGLAHAGLHLLCAPLGAELARLAERERHVLAVALGRADGSAPGAFAVGAALVELLAATAARCPLLLLLDDVHQLDPQSRAALAFALRRLGGDPVGAVLATRPGPDHPTVTGLPTITLTGIDLEGALAMTARRGLAVSRPVLADLLAATDTNPLAVLLAIEEMDPAQRLGLRPWTPGPPVHLDHRVGAGVLERLADDGPDAGLALLVVALSDTEDRSLVHAALELALGPAGPGLLDPLADRGLVHLGPAVVQLTHPLVRPAITSHLPAAGHRQARLAIAEALEERGGVDDAARAAFHRAAVAPAADEALAVRLHAVGDRSAGRGDLAQAARAYEAAGQLSARGELRAERHLLAGHAAATAGLDDAQRLLAAARRHATGTDLSDRVDALATAVAVWSGDTGRALSIAARHSLPAPADAPASRRAVLAMIHGAAAVGSWARWDAVALARCAAQVPPVTADLPVEALIVGTAGRALAALATGHDPSVELLVAAAAHHRHPSPDVAPPLLQALLLADQVGAAQTVLTEALAVGRRRAAVPALAWLFLASAQLALRRGALQTALGWAQEAGELARAVELPLVGVQSRVYAESVGALIGVPARVGVLAELSGAAAELESGAVLVYLHLAAARAAAGSADVSGAIAEYRETTRRLALMGRTSLAEFPASPELVTVLLRAGRTGEALAEADRLAGLTAGDPRPSSRAWAAHVRALVSTGPEADGCYTAAFAEWAAAGVAGAGALLPTADLHHDDGLRLARAGRPDAARAAFGAALRVFEACGSRVGAQRTRQALLDLGGGPQPPVRLSALTSREQTIASLVATGSTNREIAQALSLSHKTVESHLGSIFRKMNVRTRTEMAHHLTAAGSPH